MNIIIVGCGRIGSTLVEELSGENQTFPLLMRRQMLYRNLQRHMTY